MRVPDCTLGAGIDAVSERVCAPDVGVLPAMGEGRRRPSRISEAA